MRKATSSSSSMLTSSSPPERCSHVSTCSTNVRTWPPSSAPTTLAPRLQGVVSQYRNLLHHFVHQHGNSEASTFWAGCGAIRRSVFEEMGGFDEQRFPTPSIEDIELGYRLRQAGHRILLDKACRGRI